MSYVLMSPVNGIMVACFSHFLYRARDYLYGPVVSFLSEWKNNPAL